MIRVTFTTEGTAPTLLLWNSDDLVILESADYVTETALTIPWGEDDLAQLRFDFSNMNENVEVTNIEFDSGKYRPKGWWFPTNSGLLSVKSFWTDDYRPGSIRIAWSGDATYVQATLTDVPGTDFDTWTATANRQIHKIQWGHHDLQSITFAGDNTFYLTDLEFFEDIPPETE